MKKRTTRKLLSLVMALCLMITTINAVPSAAKAADINNIGNPDYRLGVTPGGDAFVYAYNVMDYGADNTGNNDNTTIFQRLLNKVGELGGGIVYAPTGRYKITGSLSIPRGVVLYGDWTKPDKSKALPSGTILMAYTGRNGNERSTPFIEMCIETGVQNLTIWYPEQDPNNIVPYSPTIRLGFNNYFGNEYSNTNNITLVNSYIGVLFNYDNFGAAPVVKNVYGTTLKTGVEVDKIADVGRVDGINLSPDYWINSGLANAPTNVESFRSYMKNNAIGVIMRRNDWSYTCNLTIDGYKSGYNTEVSVGSDETPNGHHYNFNFTNCTTGITVNATNGVGILFDEINIKNCENGILINDGTSDVVEIIHADIDASTYALRTSEKSCTNVLFNNSKVRRGQVAINGGTLTANTTAFDNKAPQVYFGLAGRGILTACTYKEGKQISNNSIYEISVNDSQSLAQTVDTFPGVEYDSHTPVRKVLYNAAAYNVNTGAYDNTQAIQNALDKASEDGGGIVFIPSGHYKVRGHLSIPSGVELRGALDIQTVPHGGGTILEAFENRGNEDGASFIQLKANAGIRGIVIDYPEQVFDGSANWMPAAYPYTIQGQGANVYVINTCVRASYKGLDLSTYRCDNHYVDFMGGHVFNVGVKVGNNCSNGKLYNMMFNVIVYACGNESKFGSFSNMPNGVSNSRPYGYGLDYMDFMILGDCTNEQLYNDFHYGSRHGLVFENEGNGGPSGSSMGLGIDGAARSVYVKPGTTKTFDLYNTQVVSIVGSSAADTSYYQVDNNTSMKVNVYNSDYWGQPNKGIETGNNSSVINLYSSFFSNPGQTSLAASNGGDIKITGSALNQNGTAFVDTGSESNISVTGSSVNNRNNATGSFAAWNTNQGTSPVMAANSPAAALNRSGWSATASNNNNNARNALDGNVGTRWDTAGSQQPGQWFAVDFGGNYTFNTLILDLGSSTADGPAGYEIYATNDLNNYGSVIASGSGGGGIIRFDTQNKRYAVVKQTGSKGNYWSIHEFYALNSSAAGNDLPNGVVPSTEEPDEPVEPENPYESIPALDRTGWSATASNNNGGTGNAFDGNLATRWSTNTLQVPNQTFTVDMGKAVFFDIVEMLLGTSANDSPAAYEIYVSLDGTSWGSPVKTGTDQSEDFEVGMQCARYVKIVQTGNKGLYWSIHEFNLKNSEAASTYKVAYVDNGSIISMGSHANGSSSSLMNAPQADGKVFAGWYTAPVTLNSANAIRSAAAYAANTSVNSDAVLYAGWINIGTGNKSFDLLGTQVRVAEPTGLRFITQIGTQLIAQVEALNAANNSLQPDSTADKGIGFGTVLMTASKLNGRELVKDVNATQVNKGMVVSPAVKLFERTNDYYQYTAVVTGINAKNYQTEIAARPYITYRDANGIERTYYYTEANSTAGGGYSVSIYRAAKAYYNAAGVSSSVKNWLNNNIISVVEN
ncbi:MAG: discoidin domain-containing protein [Lachnospiraceae bacterium]|nr:discoidin domain-containing protein [Lachnospiraceae bacterium]